MAVGTSVSNRSCKRAARGRRNSFPRSALIRCRKPEAERETSERAPAKLELLCSHDRPTPVVAPPSSLVVSPPDSPVVAPSPVVPRRTRWSSLPPSPAIPPPNSPVVAPVLAGRLSSGLAGAPQAALRSVSEPVAISKLKEAAPFPYRERLSPC